MVNHHPPLVIKFIIVTCEIVILLLFCYFYLSLLCQHLQQNTELRGGDIKQYTVTTTTPVVGATVEGGWMEMEKSVRVGWWYNGTCL